MTDEQLAALQDKIMHDTIDAPAEMEAMIQDTAAKVARDLSLKASQTARAEFEDELYIFKATKTVINFKQVVHMVIVNEEHRKLGGNKYRPYTATAEIDNGFSYEDNLRAVVETFLRHISGAGETAQVMNE